ncbi:MAG: helix-turn-helix domain-containing protein [Desulfuromonadales bacterium]|nr:helix-turn-helix domain-containing protein [Desulfuromonadales bacterium]
MRVYTQLTQEQRYQIYALMKAHHRQAEIAVIVGVHKSMVSRERIYQHILRDKVQGGGLYRHLRCQKARRKRYGSYDRRGQLHNRVSIDVTPANTLIAAAGADAWRVPSFANSIFVNIRPSSVNRGHRRDNAPMIRTIRHEAVHAVDVSGGTGDIEHYKMEFRAYWMEGNPARDALSSAFNPSMDNNGPKSERSRDIFDHVYGNPTYPWVKPNYDANTSGFRDQVNAYIVPDGINLIVSDDLANFRNLIAGLPAGPYAAQQAGVQAAFAALNALEEREIRGNRAWRELVESKYSGSDLDDIKNDLNIPR